MGKSWIQVLLMAGGDGTRFAPLSTPEFPKQFHYLTNPNRSVLQQCFDYLQQDFKPTQIWVTTSERHRKLATDQLPTVPTDQIIGEPIKKNTAPGIAYVAQCCYQKQPESILITLSSDLYVPEPSKLCEILIQAAHLAREKNRIVVLGKRPTRPATQFGYIQTGDIVSSVQSAYIVRRFVEKPDQKTAESYCQGEGFYWNSGIFVAPTKLLLEEIARHLPSLARALQEKDRAQCFGLAPNISIDYGLMEKTDRALMIPIHFDWYDLGTWESLNDLVEKENTILPPQVLQIMNKHLQSDAENR